MDQRLFDNASELLAEPEAPRRRMEHYTWAQPGDPPNADYESVRAPRPAESVLYANLTREQELELVRAYHEDGDLDALEQLVGAQRPMVVRMAKHLRRGNGTSLKALVEYGMVGVGLAAEPPRPSQTKKGKLVGFDVSSGNRFSTYAREYARKEMRAALTDDPPPVERSAEQEATVQIEAEAWHMGESLRGTPGTSDEQEAEIIALGASLRDATGVVRHFMDRVTYHRPYRPWTFWHPTQPQRKPRPRNFLKHPRTATELANMDARHARHWRILAGHEGLAESGMEGWDANGKADFDFLVASSHGSRHVLKGKDYRVSMKFMRFWWKLGRKRLGLKLEFSTNQGLGTCNRCGFLLPDFSFLAKTSGFRKRKRPGPYLCLKPLASILLVRGRNTARFFPQNKRYPPMEHSKCLTRLISAKYFRLGCQWAPSRSWHF